MSAFYKELSQRLEKESCWAVTILTGENAGKKYISEKPIDTIEEERVFCEKVGNAEKLVICGGGHVSMPIIKIGKMLGFQVTVLEDRPQFANHARIAGADHVICEEFTHALSSIDGDADTYFIIVTRGHRYDALCLEEILKKSRAYVGMMGSRRRVAIVKENLKEKGTQTEQIDSVYTPIGLDIGAETPEEIAISILAEVIQIKRKNSRAGIYSKELLSILCGEKYREQKKVLATIISRKGSAPRGVGTKMLVLEDGTIIDTIGGGCAESDVIAKALLMMRREEPYFQICTVDMSMEAAEEEGMVCGGRLEVMLERVKD